MRKCMLSTIDNPFDPFDEFDSWFMLDNDLGHGCCSLVARFGKFSDQLTEQENDAEQENAIDEIIKLDFTNVYKKVVKNVEEEIFIEEGEQ